MFGMGIGEILVVLVIALLFLGPEKIPETARTLGKWAYELKRSIDGLKDAFEKDVKPPPEKSKNESETSANFPPPKPISKDPPPNPST